MNKIALFTTVSLMSSVAFGQVNWGKFEKALDRGAQQAVAQSFSKEKTNRICNSLADQVELTVVDVLETETSLGGEMAELDVTLAGASVYAVVRIQAVDRYHSDEWAAKVRVCNLHAVN